MKKEIILAIFAHYPKQPILICEPNIEPVCHYLEGVDFTLGEVIAERVNWNPEWIKLHLKSLNSISDEDSISVAEMIYKSDKFTSVLIDEDGSRRVISENGIIVMIFTDGSGFHVFDSKNHSKDLFVEDYLFGYQFLQSKGYALPYLKYSVEDLVKCGVYQLINLKK